MMDEPTILSSDINEFEPTIHTDENELYLFLQNATFTMGNEKMAYICLIFM